MLGVDATTSHHLANESTILCTTKVELAGYLNINHCASNAVMRFKVSTRDGLQLGFPRSSPKLEPHVEHSHASAHHRHASSRLTCEQLHIARQQRHLHTPRHDLLFKEYSDGLQWPHNQHYDSLMIHSSLSSITMPHSSRAASEAHRSSPRLFRQSRYSSR